MSRGGCRELFLFKLILFFYVTDSERVTIGFYYMVKIRCSLRAFVVVVFFKRECDVLRLCGDHPRGEPVPAFSPIVSALRRLCRVVLFAIGRQPWRLEDLVGRHGRIHPHKCQGRRRAPSAVREEERLESADVMFGRFGVRDLKNTL